jgi:WD40 repeat protein
MKINNIYIKLYCMCFNSNGDKLISGDKDGKIIVWDLVTMRQVNKI